MRALQRHWGKGLLVFVAALTYLTLTTLVENDLFNYPLSWDSVIASGGLSLGKPVQVDRDRWFIPLRCDVSGEKAISVEPAHWNPKSGIRRIKLNVKDDVIYVQIYSTLITPGTDWETYGFYITAHQEQVYNVIYESKEDSVLVGRIALLSEGL